MKPYLAMFLGLCAMSTSAIFIRFAQEAETPSLVVAAGRLVIASLILTPFVVRRYHPELRTLSPFEVKLGLLSGLVLGLHFATWISSLEYTSVVNSVVLVTTTPLWVALLSPFFLKEKLTRSVIIGLIVAFSGGMLVAISGDSGNPPTRSDPLLGNGLAVIGALMAAIYVMIGRRLRARLTIIPYIWMVYGTAAVVLVIAMILSGDGRVIRNLTSDVFLWLVLLALVPQLIGHSSFNYALGYLSAAYVSLVTLGEPIGSGVLAIIFLDEWPVVLQLVGSVLILSGIALATRDHLPQNE